MFRTVVNSQTFFRGAASSIHRRAPQIRGSSRRESLNSRTMNLVPAQVSPKRFNLGDFATFLMFGLSASAIAYISYLANQPRETKILHAPIDLSYYNRATFIVHSTEYIEVGRKPKGDLSGAIVEDKEGRRYLKKGAKDLNGLLEEFLISDFLAMLYPGIQPESLIMQETQADGRARFYTLSRMYENSMDLEAFVRLGDWKEKLMKKPLIGFEIALAADNAFAKQQDMKLANYVVIEREDGYYVVSIDHECAGTNYFNIANSIVFTTDIDKLVRGVRDLYPADEHNRAGLAGKPEAKEFMSLARTFMNEENVLSFYQKIAEAKISKVTDLISSINGVEGLITALQTHKYFDEVATVQSSAVKFMYDHFVSKKIKDEDQITSHQSQGNITP